jgi:hypothetical protein
MKTSHSHLYLHTRTMHMGAFMHALMKMFTNACVLVRVRAGMTERERERARAYVCMCMCESLCKYVCMCMGVHA